jgi:hypothetical protein
MGQPTLDGGIFDDGSVEPASDISLSKQGIWS